MDIKRRTAEELARNIDTIEEWSKTPAAEVMGRERFEEALLSLRREYHEVTGHHYKGEDSRQGQLFDTQ